MSNNMQEIAIRFGGLAPSIADQLKEQGFTFANEKAQQFQQLRECITRLMFADILNESQKDKAFSKLFNQIKKHIRGNNKTSQQTEK